MTSLYNKVIILTGFYAPSIGGMEKRLEKWASVLQKNGIEVEVFTTAKFSNVRKEHLNGITVIRDGDSFGEWVVKAREYVGKNCDANTVILVSALGPGMDAGLLGCLERAHANGGKTAMSVPTADHLARAIARNEGAREFLQKVDRLITVSDDVKEFSKYSREVIYLPNFIMDNDLQDLSDPYPSTKNVAFFGRIAKRKRPEMLVEIARLLPEGVRLVVQGPAGYGEEELYDDIVAELRALNATILDPSETPDRQVIEAKYFINPSEVEGCSNALLEAMGRGSIPLVSDIKENRKVLGGLIPLCPDGAAGFIEVLKGIMDSEIEVELQRTMRSHIIAKYSEQKIAPDLVKALTVF